MNALDLSKQDWQVLEEEIISCRRCPRLVAWREEIARVRRRAYRDQVYWGRPVAGFGDPQGQVLVVGLAPGAHGANRTGRIFTGDGSGEFLYRALHKAGFANQATSSHRQDGLVLNNLFISAICRCAPPANKPSPDEIGNCLPFLQREITFMQNLRVIVALGKIAFDNTLRIYRQQGIDLPRLEFAHGAVSALGEGLPWMVVSYHPSRQNTHTGRLTEEMFAHIWDTVKKLL